MRTMLSRGLVTLTVGLGVGAFVPALVHAEAPQNPTFSKHVAPILQAKCETCHRPGSIAPMSLIAYPEVRPWARSIKARVETRQMPPWHIDRSVGVQKFKNDMSLSDAEIETITTWVDQGAPRGNPADMPATRWPSTSTGTWNSGPK